MIELLNELGGWAVLVLLLCLWVWRSAKAENDRRNERKW